jgi:hypothetical protein
VERVKVREFVEALGEHNPIFRDRQSALSEGYSDTPCPPTFFTSAFQEFTGIYFRVFEELGVKLENVLHGEEEYTYFSEVYPGETLRCHPRIDSITEKESSRIKKHINSDIRSAKVHIHNGAPGGHSSCLHSSSAIIYLEFPKSADISFMVPFTLQRMICL